jgi:hypothetical protein
MTVHVGLTKTALAMLDATTPETQVTTGGAVAEFLLQACLNQPVTGQFCCTVHKYAFP